jgi:hypothetical protein
MFFQCYNKLKPNDPVNLPSDIVDSLFDEKEETMDIYKLSYNRGDYQEIMKYNSKTGEQILLHTINFT